VLTGVRPSCRWQACYAPTTANSKATENSAASASSSEQRHQRLPGSVKLNRSLQCQSQWQGRRHADIVASWGAALRSRTAGSQDQSGCSAIHKFNGKFNDDGNPVLLRRNPPAQPEGCGTKTERGDAASEERSFSRCRGIRMTAQVKCARSRTGRALRFFGGVGCGLRDWFAFVEAGPVF